jgi:hypothetical protein
MLLRSLEKVVILAQAGDFEERTFAWNRHALPERDRMHYSWRLACRTVAPKKNSAFNPRSP